jgi:magnesium chelatase subunit D
MSLTAGRAAPRSDARPHWARALEAASLLAIDPVGLGGAWLRAGAGPARERWLSILRNLSGQAAWRKLPAGTGDDRLIGGLDLAATLALQRPVVQTGVLAEADGGVLIAASAERLASGQAARIAAAMDQRVVAVEREGVRARTPARFALVLLDEGEGDERAPAALRARTAFHLSFDDATWTDLEQAPAPVDIAGARAVLARAEPCPEVILAALVEAAAALGVDEPTAPLLALRAARAAAARDGRVGLTLGDAVLAAELVLAPRARALPAPPPDQPAEPAQQEPPVDTAPSDPELSRQEIPADIVVAAAAAAVPSHLLADLARGGAPAVRNTPEGGSGQRRAARQRGRRIGVRAGVPAGGARLAVLETLRAAAPWQGLRGGVAAGADRRLRIRPEDFRIRRHADRVGATIIFAVDASGSSAFQRLGEAKGAIELVLADAYAARTQVALIAFRGHGATLILPATRSLTRARNQLAGLAGGGATPLAGGLDAAHEIALAERAKGRTPLILMLTDGRANVSRAGETDRAAAKSDALAAAARLRVAGLRSVLVDTGRWPSPEARALSEAMGARYAPLPHVRADGLSQIVAQEG